MFELIAIALLVGLVWGTIFVLRGSLVVGAMLVILALNCFGYLFTHFEAGPLPLTIDRVMLGALIAAYIVQRALGRTDEKPLNAGDWATLAFVGYLLVNMFTGDWQNVQKKEMTPPWRWFGGYCTPLLLYWVAKQAPWKERTSNLMLGCLTAFGAYLAITAVLEIAQVWALVFPKYIADPKVGLHFGRARGPMVHGVSYGHFQDVCLLALWLTAYRLRGTSRWFMAAMVPLFMAGVYFSYTRSVWIGAVLGICTLLWTTLRGATRTYVLGGLAAAAMVVGLTQMDKIVGFQREQSAADTADSANLRVSFAYVSWLMFQDKPIFGFGFGRFPTDKIPYLADRTSDLNLEDLRPYVHHNTFLSILVDTGIVGLGMFLAMIGLWVKGGIDTYRAEQTSDWARRQAILMLGAVGIYACQLLFHELSYTAMDNALMFFLAGAASAVVPRRERSQAAPRREAQRVEAISSMHAAAH